MRQTPIYIMNDVQCEGGWGLGPPSNFLSMPKILLQFHFHGTVRDLKVELLAKQTDYKAIKTYFFVKKFNSFKGI